MVLVDADSAVSRLFPTALALRRLERHDQIGGRGERSNRRGISREIIDIIKHRKDTSSLDEADATVIELGREIFGARKVASQPSLDHYARKWDGGHVAREDEIYGTLGDDCEDPSGVF